MKINGHIDIIDVKTGDKLCECDNTFTNTGRQHVCDWLLHNNYSEDVLGDGINDGMGGRSVSDMRIIPYTSVQASKTGTSSYTSNPEYAMYPYNKNYDYATRLKDQNQFWEDYPYNYNDDYGTVFYEFDKPYDLKAIMMWARQTDDWDRQFLIEISTSPNTIAENQVNPVWNRQRIDEFETYWDNTWGNRNRCIMYNFDFHDHPYRIVENVRTVRIRTCYLDWTTTWASLYGIWFMEATPYPNTPSVLALGTGQDSPLVTDTSLSSEAYRKFVRRHKDMNNDYQIKYSTRLFEHEANGHQFSEVGLFFLPDAGDYIGGDHGPDVCTSLFARGMFDTSWTKSEGQILDVDYTLTITN